MRKYTIHFLILTLITGILGFTGLEFPGDIVVRLVCLIAGIGLLISCLDAVILSRRQRRLLREKQNMDLKE